MRRAFSIADAIHVPCQLVNDIVNSRRSITPSTTLRLAKFFNISTDFWMNLQMRWDMYFAHQDEMDILKTIKPIHSPEIGEKDSSVFNLIKSAKDFITN